MADKKVALPDFLTDAQIEQALAIWKRRTTPAREIAEVVIEPNMAEIERKMGQECNALYLAYCCEYVFNETQRRDPG